MIAVSELQLYNILWAKLGEKEAESLVEFVDFKLKENNEQNLRILATKEDIEKLRVEIQKTTVDTIKWVFAFFVTLMLAIVGLYLKG